MIKQSRTTIKELTAQYRAVLKRAFLAGVAAVAVSTTSAMAVSAFENEIAGDAVATSGETFYTTDTIDTIKDTKPDGTTYNYKDKAGNTVYLNADGTAATGATESDYTGTSAVNSTNGSTTQTIEHGASQSMSNYSFNSTSLDLSGDAIQFNEDGSVKIIEGTTTFSGSAPTALTGKITLQNKAVAGTPDTLTITKSSVTADLVKAVDYTIDINGTTYHLKDASGTITLVDATENDVSSSFPDKLTELKTKYTTDAAKVNAAVSAITTADNKNTTNYNAVSAAYGTDGTTISNLTTNYASLTDALNDFSTVDTAYNESLGKAVDDHVDAGIVANNAEQLGEINSLAANTSTTNPKAAANLAAKEGEATVSDHLVKLASVAADNKDAISAEETRAKAAEEAIQQDLIARDVDTLNSANAYTDKQVESLEKNMSAGIASAAALSSVEVSNVKRGELSIGGGYGYHNNQSAAAFGAAMGLSDNWSLNAGVGMGFNDSSNVTVRAGTNYKFKLF